MRLDWIKFYIDNPDGSLKEVHYSRLKNVFQRGRTLVKCPVCQQWVSEHDYETYCKWGYHEYAEPVVIDNEIKRLKLKEA